MEYFYILVILAITGFIYMRFEAGYLEVKKVEFSRNNGDGALKILQLSDIHIRYLKVSSEEINKVIDKEKPDLIIITGDCIDTAEHIPMFMKFLEAIKGSNNMFLCLGNHDYEAFQNNAEGLELFMKGIENEGIKILHNRSICYEKGSKKYNIIGIADLNYTKYNIEEAFKTICPNASTTIAFSHNPDIVLEIPEGKTDYLLCGHFHGGQIWMPFNLEFRVLRNEKLCKMGIKRGFHRINGINLYINRGLGNVLFPLRFLSRPEVTIFYLP